MENGAARVLEERVDINKVSYLLENYTYEEFLTNFIGTQKDAKTMFNKIVKYLNSKVSGERLVRYNYIKGRVDGRLFGEANSIQGLPKNVRGFICDGITTDIDMVNAHPSILKKLCDEHNIECPNLYLYINERKYYLNKIAEEDNITYEQAKQKILIATNSNRKINSNNAFMKSYSKEMGALQKAFMNIREYDYIKEYARRENNFEGSFINHILCIHENIILSSIIDWVKNYSIEIHSLMFDGLMVYGEITEPTLLDIQKHISKTTIFDNITLSIKPHDTTFVLPKDYLPTKLITYEDVKKEFEKENCKVDDRFVRELNGEVKIYSRTKFMDHHEDKIYKETLGGVNKKFINRWLEDPDKVKYDDFGSYPKQSLCPSNYYNLWKPFPVKMIMKYKDIDKCKKALDFFLKHLKNVLCDHDEKVFDFVCMWIAQMFQYPEHKSIEIIFISDVGVGKGLFLQFFKTIMGGGKRCWETTKPQKEVFGDFNGGMKDAFLVCFNETNKSNFYNVNDMKKGLITDGYININIKGWPQFTIHSYHRFLSFTNNPEPSTKNARRDIFIKCSDEKEDEEYFNEGFDYANDLECCAYIYNYFMKYATKVKINAVDIPKTEYDEVIKEAQENPIVSFIKDFISEAKLAEVVIDVEGLFDKYKNYCYMNDVSLDGMTKVKFGVRLHFLKGKNIKKEIKKIDKKARNVYTLNIPELLKQYRLTD